MRIIDQSTRPAFTGQHGPLPACPAREGVLWLPVQRHTQPRHPLPHFRLFPPVKRLCFFETDPNEKNPVSWPKLTEHVQIGTDDLGDLRIPADRLAVHAQNDALSVARYLDRPRTHRLGDEFTLRPAQYFAAQTRAHAVTITADHEH